MSQICEYVQKIKIRDKTKILPEEIRWLRLNINVACQVSKWELQSALFDPESNLRFSWNNYLTYLSFNFQEYF